MLDDLGETIDCPNCGRPNPGWAQVCRNCGFSLRRGLARSVGKPQRPFPTDQTSLLSIGAAVGSIVLAIVLGMIFSAVNPTKPTVGVSSSPTPSPVPSLSPSLVPEPSASIVAEATPSATAALPDTITFGTGLTASKAVSGKTDTFGPGSYFAHSVAAKNPFGVSTLYETVVRVADDGTESAVQTRYPVPVNKNAKVFGFVVSTSSLLRDWAGGGNFVMRIYDGQTLIAQGSFTLKSS
jgi:hypothetical protein